MFRTGDRRSPLVHCSEERVDVLARNNPRVSFALRVFLLSRMAMRVCPPRGRTAHHFQGATSEIFCNRIGNEAEDNAASNAEEVGN